jgi:hypothetical protein
LVVTIEGKVKARFALAEDGLTARLPKPAATRACPLQTEFAEAAPDRRSLLNANRANVNALVACRKLVGDDPIQKRNTFL